MSFCDCQCWSCLCLLFMDGDLGEDWVDGAPKFEVGMAYASVPQCFEKYSGIGCVRKREFSRQEWGPYMYYITFETCKDRQRLKNTVYD